MAAMLKGRVAGVGSIALAVGALVFASGCSQATEDDTSASEARVSGSGKTTAPGASFVKIEYGDEVVGSIGGDENVIEAQSSRSYGIGAIGAYVLHKKDGGVFGVITAYGRTDGAAKVEVVTNMDTGQSAFVIGDEFRSSMGDENGVVKEDFLSAFKADLEIVQRHLPKDDGTGIAGIQPLGISSGSCGARIIKSLFTGVLGAGIFGGSAYVGTGSLVIGMLSASSYGTVSLGVVAGILGSGIGIVAGVALVGIGVFTLGAATVYCLRE